MECKTLNGESRLKRTCCYILQHASSYMANCNHKLVSMPSTICCFFSSFFQVFFMFFIFNAPYKAKEKSNVFFFKLLFFYSHCAVSNFGSVLWLKFEPCSPFEVETKWKWKKKTFNIVIIPLKKSSSC